MICHHKISKSAQRWGLSPPSSVTCSSWCEWMSPFIYPCIELSWAVCSPKFVLYETKNVTRSFFFVFVFLSMYPSYDVSLPNFITKESARNKEIGKWRQEGKWVLLGLVAMFQISNTKSRNKFKQHFIY
jgi:hypothetical protein